MSVQQLFEFMNDAAYRTRPIACSILAEQPRGRIPGAVVAIEQPAKVRYDGQKDPDRFGQGPGQMGDAGIDRNHQIQIRDHGGGIGEGFQLVVKMQKIAAILQHRCIVSANIPLQAHEVGVNIEERQQPDKLDRPLGVVPVRRRA